MKSDILLISELAEEWGCATKIIRKMIKEGLPCINIGGITFFRLSDCQAWWRGENVEVESTEIHEVDFLNPAVVDKGLYITKQRRGKIHTAAIKTDAVKTKKSTSKIDCYKWLLEGSGKCERTVKEGCS